MQAGDPGDLHARAELELVAGDGRADDHADEPGLDAVLGQRALEGAALLLDELTIDLLGLAAIEQLAARQLPRRPLGRGAEIDRELLGLARLVVGLDRTAEFVVLGVGARRPRSAPRRGGSAGSP